MKKKTRLIGLLTLSVSVALCMGIGLSACGKGDVSSSSSSSSVREVEEEPVITVTSSDPATITKGGSYLLVYSVENAAGGVTVEASGGVYDEETNMFTADSAGEYTLTIKATNVTKTAEKTVTVQVVELPAPEISFEGDTEAITGNVGEEIEIPKVTITSDGEYDLFVTLADSVVRGITLTESAENPGAYTLTSEVGGEIRIGYIASLKADPQIESTKVINVKVTPATSETEVDEAEGLGEYATALEKFGASSEGETVIYTENFEKGYASQFTTWGVSQEASEVGSPECYLTGTEDAISGNSYVLDYTGIKKAGATSRIYYGFGNLFRQGVWKVEFDVKLLSGTLEKISGENNAQFCVFPTGENVAYRWYYAIGQEVSHVTLDIGAKRFKDSNSVAMIVQSSDYTQLKIVIDNIRLTYQNISYPVVETPGGTQARLSADTGWKDTTTDEASFTINGNNDGNWTALSGSGNPVYLDRDTLKSSGLLTEEQAAAMTAENGFGDNVIHVIGQSNVLDALTGGLTLSDFFTTKSDGTTVARYEITIEMKVIGSTSGWTFLVQGSGISTSVSGDGTVKTVSWTGLPDASYQEISFYNGGVADAYIGEIKISRSKHIDIAVNPGTLLTEAPAWENNKITLNTTANNLTALEKASFTGEYIYVDRTQVVDAGLLTSEEYATAFTEANGFSADETVPVMYLNGSQTIWFSALDGLFDDPDDGYDYSITIRGYAISASNWHLWRTGSKALVNLGDKSHTAFSTTVSISKSEDFAQCGLYIGGSVKLFISSIEVTRSGSSAVNRPLSGESAKTLAWSEGVDTLVLTGGLNDYSDTTDGSKTATQEYVELEKAARFGEIDTSLLTEANGFFGYAVRKGSGTTYFSALSGLFTDSDYEYTVKFTIYVEGKLSNWHAWLNGGSAGQLNGDYTVSGTNVADVLTKEVTFRGTGAESNAFGIYVGGAADKCYIGAITITRKLSVQINVEPTNLLTEAPAWENDKIALNTTANNLTALEKDSFTGEYSYIDRTKIVAAGWLTSEEYAAAFTEANGFSADETVPVMYLNGSQTIWFSALNGLFDDPTDGYDYSITIRGYAISASNWHLWRNNNGSSLGQVSDLTKQAFSKTVTLTQATDFTKFGLYIGGSVKIFISSIEITRTVNINVEPTNLLTEAPEWENNKIVLNTTANNLTAFDKDSFTGQYSYIDRAKIVAAGLLTSEEYAAAFTEANGFSADETVPVMYLNGSQTMWFDALEGLFDDPTDGYTYSITIKGFAINTKGWYLWNNGSSHELANLGDLTKQAFTGTVSVTAATDLTKIGIYVNQSAAVFIGSIEITRTPV